MILASRRPLVTPSRRAKSVFTAQAGADDDPTRWGAALLYGQAWDYADTDALQTANKFFCLPTPDGGRGNHLTELITTDPVFPKCVRITHKYNDDQSGDTGDVPRHFSSDFSSGDCWARFRFKYYPGFTTSGTYPTGAAASWKQIFLHYGAGAGNRFEYELLGSKWFCAYAPSGVGNLSGATILSGPVESLGEVQDLNLTTAFNAFTTAQWIETVQHYVRYNGNLNARWRWWCRQLSENDVRVNNSWYFTGRERSTDGAMPPIVNVSAGINRNKTSAADALSTTAYSGSGSGGPFKGYHSYWAQIEVVDGTQQADPYGVASWGL